MKKFIIIPNCSDLNRGDQALVWETKRIAEDAGYVGDYYVTVEDNEPIQQSIEHGLIPLSMILKHPSRFFKHNDNITYSISLKLKWGFVAFVDLITSSMLLSYLTRWIVMPFLSKAMKDSIKIFKESDALFIKGGGFIHFYGGFTSLYYAYFSLFHIFFASALKKQIFILPNSIGPYKGFGVKWLVKQAFKRCKLVTVRETFSQEMAKKELGLKLPFYPDLALYLPTTKVNKNILLDKYGIPEGRKIVAMTMRPHRFPNSKTPQEDYAKFKHEMADFIEYLYYAGYLPMLIDHTLAINTNENDAVCIKEVTEMVTSGHYFYFSDTSLNCEELKSIYSICDYIVGTRFHSVIFSFANNIPGIAIRYTGNKAQGIMHDFGLSDYAIEIENVTCKGLIEKFNNLLQNEDNVKSLINSYLNFAYGARLNLIDKLKNK